MNQQQTIEEFQNSLSSIVDTLNDALVSIYGEEADWSKHVGSSRPPKFLCQNPEEFVLKIWAAREEANSALNWVDMHCEAAA